MLHHGLTNFQYFCYHAILILCQNQAVNYRKMKENEKVVREQLAAATARIFTLENWKNSLYEQE
jgi:hypothetical protein